MPCDYSKYPSDWKEIRKRILERDENKCKFCGVANYEIGYRDKNGEWYSSEIIHAALENGHDMFDDVLSNCFDAKGEPTKPIKIILTTMHLDHDTTNNADENLAAGCQKCHNSYDAKFRKGNARKTNAKKKKLIDLFTTTTPM